MHELPPLNPLERELESRLGQLSPARHRINRDQLMFRAGHASGRRLARRWRNATMAMLVLGLASTAPWRVRNSAEPTRNLAANATRPPLPPPVLQSATGPQAATPATRIVPFATADHLRLREQVLREGVEALPSVRWAPLPDRARITAGSWRPRPEAGNPADDPLWQGNLNDKSKRS